MSLYAIFPQTYYYGLYTGSTFTTDASTYLANIFNINTGSLTAGQHVFVLANTSSSSTPSFVLVEYYNGTSYLNQTGTLPTSLQNGGIVVQNIVTGNIIFAISGSTVTATTATGTVLFTFASATSFSIAPIVSFIPSSTSTTVASSFNTLYGTTTAGPTLIVVNTVTDTPTYSGSIYVQTTLSSVTTIHILGSPNSFTTQYLSTGSPTINYTVQDAASNNYVLTNAFNSSCTYSYTLRNVYTSAYFITTVTLPLTSANIVTAVTAKYPTYIPNTGDYVFVNNSYALLFVYNASAAWVPIYNATGYNLLLYNNSQLFDNSSQIPYIIINSGSTGSPGVSSLSYIAGSVVEYTNLTGLYYLGTEINTVVYNSTTGALTTSLGATTVVPSVPVNGNLILAPTTYNTLTLTPNQVVIFQYNSSGTWTPINMANSSFIRDNRYNNFYVYTYAAASIASMLTTVYSYSKLNEAVLESYTTYGMSSSSSGLNMFEDNIVFIPTCLDSATGQTYYTLPTQPPVGSNLMTTNIGFTGTLSLNTNIDNLLVYSQSGWAVNTTLVTTSTPQVGAVKFSKNGTLFTIVYYFYVTNAVQPCGSYFFSTYSGTGNTYNNFGNSYISGGSKVTNTALNNPVPVYAGNSVVFSTNTNVTNTPSTYFTVNTTTATVTNILTLNTPSVTTAYNGIYRINVAIPYYYTANLTLGLSLNAPLPFFYLITSTSGFVPITAFIPKISISVTILTVNLVQQQGTLTFSTTASLTAGTTISLYYHPNHPWFLLRF